MFRTSAFLQLAPHPDADTLRPYPYSIMSAITDNSPIQRLDLDILWCIIKMNADMFNDPRALNTTLATSLVCREWHSFMLNTTSIWAHLIDLDHWIWRRVKGSHEMIRRTGTAFLWVKSRRLVVSDIIFRHLFYFRQTTGCESRGSKYLSAPNIIYHFHY